MHSLFSSTLPTSPLMALLVVFVAGLLSVATPCVLPMVPITLATIGITRASSRGRALLTAAAYVAGIVLTFTSLGIAFAMTGRLFGSLLANPVTTLVIATVFVTMGLSCFEILPFRLPAWLTQAVVKIGGNGPVGAFTAGLVAGFIAAPCIGPVLAGILSYVTTTHDVLWGAALLATYGLGFGTPFLIVGAFALRLPKAGAWMEAVKGVFGVALFVGAYWFLRGAFPVLRWSPHLAHPLPLALLMLLGGLCLLVLAFSRQTHKALRATVTVLATCGGILLINTVLDSDLRWCEEQPDRPCTAESVKTHDRTLVLYTADWCPACHKLEGQTLTDPKVMERLRRYGTVIVDVDANPDVTEKAHIAGMPTVVALDGEGKVIGTLLGYVPPDEFLQWLDTVEKK